MIAFEEKCSFKRQVRSIQCVLSTTPQHVMGEYIAEPTPMSWPKPKIGESWVTL